MLARFFSQEQCQTDPPVPRILRQDNLVWGYIHYGGSKGLRRGLRHADFLGEIGSRSLQIVKNYCGSQILRLQAP